MSTLHLDAARGAIADTVLLPGDPLRARHIAHRFLTQPVEINARRNMLGYTGHHAGARLTVLGSGMGIPSCAIYATELARGHGVRRIIRLGTCGGVGPVAVGDLILAQAASTDSHFNRMQFGGFDLSACADFSLLQRFATQAQTDGIPLRVAPIFSTDCFYRHDPGFLALLREHRILGIEMESAGLYGLAMREGIQAVSLLTVSDHLERDECMPPEEREAGLDLMVKLALRALFHPTAEVAPLD